MTTKLRAVRLRSSAFSFREGHPWSLALVKADIVEMTTSGDSVGANCVSLQVSKMRRFIGALTIKGVTIPCELRPGAWAR